MTIEEVINTCLRRTTAEEEAVSKCLRQGRAALGSLPCENAESGGGRHCANRVETGGRVAELGLGGWWAFVYWIRALVACCRRVPLA